MNKHAMVEVFDISVYGGEGLLFKIDTVVENILEYDNSKDTAKFIIKDALIDFNVASDIFNGKYKNKDLSLKGEAKVRRINENDFPVDEKVILEIVLCQIDSFVMGNEVGYVVVPEISFSLPFVNKETHGLNNFNIRIEK